MDARLIKYKGQSVYYIDGIPCIFKKVHENWAEIEVIRADYSSYRGFVAVVNNYVAHGETIRDAFMNAKQKWSSSRSFEDKKKDFLERYKEKDKLTVKELYHWHGLLTGSCEFGRNHFQEEHNLKDSDELTLEEFVELTRDAYGGEKIVNIIK